MGPFTIWSPMWKNFPLSVGYFIIGLIAESSTDCGAPPIPQKQRLADVLCVLEGLALRSVTVGREMINFLGVIFFVPSMKVWST